MERETGCCQHSFTCLLRFHIGPFCHPWDKRRGKANTSPLQGVWTQWREKKAPADLCLRRFKHSLRSPSHLPSPEETLTVSDSGFRTAGSFLLGFLLLGCRCGEAADGTSRALAGWISTSVWAGVAVSIMVDSSWKRTLTEKRAQSGPSLSTCLFMVEVCFKHTSGQLKQLNYAWKHVTLFPSWLWLQIVRSWHVKQHAHHILQSIFTVSAGRVAPIQAPSPQGGSC